jgi:hypothetical protein
MRCVPFLCFLLCRPAQLALISSHFKSYDKVLSYTLFAFFALGISWMWLTIVVMRTKCGTPRASADLFHGLQFVSSIPSRHGNPCYSADLVCVV